MVHFGIHLWKKRMHRYDELRPKWALILQYTLSRHLSAQLRSLHSTHYFFIRHLQNKIDIFLF